MKTILVPTDFSESAANAAEYAIHLSAQLNAKLILLHVYQMPAMVDESQILMITPADLKKENEELLQKETDRLKKIRNVNIRCKVRLGLTTNEILTESKNADIIVMGMRGATGKLSEVLIGSIATDTLTKTTIPVLIIPDKAKYTHPDKMVLASDYELNMNLYILEPLKKLVNVFHSKIVVVHISHKDEKLDIVKDIEVNRIENELHNIDHVSYVLQKENVIEGINEFVENKKANMLILIHHRYNLFKRLFHSSTSKKMTFHTQIPLLVLPERQ